MALIGTGAIEIPPRGYGAVEDYIANLASELGKLGHDVTVLNRSPRIGGARGRELLSALELPLDLGGHRFDILHAQSPITAEALSLSRHPYVFTSHSRYWLSEARGIERLWRVRDRRAVRSAAAVVALSPRVRALFEGIRRGPARSLVEVIPFGVDPDRFRPPPLSTARIGVIGVGVVAAHKRWDILAAATRQADVKATVVGRVQDARAQARALEINPALEFTGEVARDALPAKLASARVYVHPSDMELASVATVQAMACGLPVVGSDLLSDIVTHGENGFLVGSALPFEERVAETSDHLRRLLSDTSLWHRMSERARQTAVEEHAWNRIAARTAAFYEQALKRA